MPATWIHLALASGLCAATNGLFAKLTTGALSKSLAEHLLPGNSGAAEVVIRGVFFALNLAFNGIMWALFTGALKRGESATNVSVVNTVANFMATALFGWWVFGERLPAGWWVGAGMLVVGSVVVGRKDLEGKKVEAGYAAVAGEDGEEVGEGEEMEGEEMEGEEMEGAVSSGAEEEEGEARRRAE